MRVLAYHNGSQLISRPDKYLLLQVLVCFFDNLWIVSLCNYAIYLMFFILSQHKSLLSIQKLLSWLKLVGLGRSLICWRILISNGWEPLTRYVLDVTWQCYKLPPYHPPPHPTLPHSLLPSRTAHSLEGAKEDGGGLWFLAAGSDLCGDAVCHQRGVLPAAHLPLCHHHLQVGAHPVCQWPASTNRGWRQ